MLRTFFTVVGVAVVAFACTFAVLWLNPLQNEAIVQPIQYNHKIHVHGEEIECKECHTHVETGQVAGRPRLETCMECHDTEASDSPEEHKVRNYKEDIPFKRLFSLPEHVFFSHRRHVVVAKIKCETCHGDMGNQSKPPPHALKTLTMNQCIGCHDKKRASRDCMSCHK